MKRLNSWSVIVGLILAFLTLGRYAYSISAYSSVVGERVQALQRQRDDDKRDIKENLDYIRSRVDEIAKQLQEKK